MSDLDPSTRELAEDFKELRRSVEKAFDGLNSQLKDLGQVYIRADVYKAERSARDLEISTVNRSIDNLERHIRERLDKAESRQSANFKMALTNIVFPIVMFIVFLILTRVLGT